MGFAESFRRIEFCGAAAGHHRKAQCENAVLVQPFQGCDSLVEFSQGRSVLATLG